MSLRLHLVRHGRPVLRDDRPAAQWTLSSEDDGCYAALAGAVGFPRVGRWVSSAEPKAIGTARRLRELSGLDAELVEVAEALGEMRRTGPMIEDSEFRAAVERALADPSQPALPTWESGAAVVARVRTEVAAQCARSIADGETDLVLVGHGTAWTLLIGALTDRPADVAAWHGLQMPDWCVLDIDIDVQPVGAELVRGSVARRWGAWAGTTVL